MANQPHEPPEPIIKNTMDADFGLENIWSRDNPHSFINMLPEGFASRVEIARAEKPDWFDISEDKLLTIFKETRRNYPNPVENQLRLRLWYEYDIIQANLHDEEGPIDVPKKINMRRVCAGICTPMVFSKYLTQKLALAWLTCMPLSYESHLNEMLNFGAQEMRKVMEIPNNDPDGKLNTRIIQIKAQLYFAAELRKFGGIPQITKNVNYTGASGQATEAMRELSGDPQTEKAIHEMVKAQKREAIPVKGIKVVNEGDDI